MELVHGESGPVGVVDLVLSWCGEDVPPAILMKIHG